MHIEYGCLEQMLMRLFRLSPSQAPALGGRFKYIMSSGALQRAPIGRGRARFEIEDILRIILIFELEDAGLTPAKAIRIVENQWAELVTILSETWREVSLSGPGRAPTARVWAVVPHLLPEMGLRGVSGITLTERGEYLDPSHLGRWLRGDRAIEADRHAITINLHALLVAACAALRAVAPDIEQGFREDLDRFGCDSEVRRLGDAVA